MKDLSRSFPTWFCDIWGVVHDGISPFPKSVATLAKHRDNGGCVILVTNSPNTSPSVTKHLDQIGVAREAYDAVVTSGDVTRDLITKFGGGKIYHIGTPRDYSIFEGLETTRVALNDAKSVVCSGLFDENTETADDYLPLLTEIKQLGLTMICANPDKVVRKGSQLIPCAGALAEVYADIGGKVLMAGKPYLPIYELAKVTAERIIGKPVGKSQILAIGDGPATDIKGAADFGVPCVLITGGINTSDNITDEVKNAVPHAQILRSMVELDWT